MGPDYLDIIIYPPRKIGWSKGRLPWLADPKGGLTPESGLVPTPSIAGRDRMNMTMWFC